MRAMSVQCFARAAAAAMPLEAGDTTLSVSVEGEIELAQAAR